METNQSGLPKSLTPALSARFSAAKHVLVFSGAGVSRESGLDTFRGAGGLWTRMRPEELATPAAFSAQPERVWQWYAWRHQTATAAKPNPAHLALASWEALFPSCWVVTQNIDGLHQRAGSRNVLELHGSILRVRCTRCSAEQTMAEALALSSESPPPCSCGGRFRPDVVWFGEMLVLSEAWSAASETDVLVSIGTSAMVYPAAGLIEVALAAGASYVEINPERTPFAHRASLGLEAPAGTAVPWLTAEIERCRKPS
jgi:NAD-dependent deacetylase